MSRLNALTGRGAHTLEPTSDGPMEAIVARTATLITDDVLVTLRDFDEHRTVGPVLGWRTAPSTAWPTRGDRALVIQAPQGDYWFIAWEPA